MATITKVQKKDAGTGRMVARYRVRVVTGHLADGTAVQKMRTFTTRAEAEREAARWETNVQQGLSSEDNRERLGQFAEKWYASAAKRVRPSTLAGYRYSLDRHILPGLAGYKLRELTPQVLKDWIDAMPTPDAAARSRRVLHIILQEAVEMGKLAVNSSERVKVPPKSQMTSKAWDEADANSFLTAAIGHLYHPYWLLALRTGMRPGELLALRWAAVDLTAGTLEVRESTSTFGHHSYSGEPKTEAGRRTYDLPQDLVQALTAHRQHQREMGLGWREEDFICSQFDGSQILYCNLRRAFKTLCERAKVPAVRLYDMRHTFVSQSLAHGADIKVVSELVGHANIAITRNIYQKTYRNQRAQTLDLLTGVIKPTPNQKSGAS